MDIQRIKELALANGFKLKEQASGNMDLNAYVYDFANAIEREVKTQAVPEGFVVVEKKLIKTLHEELLDHEPDSFVVIRDICELWEQAEAQEPANEAK